MSILGEVSKRLKTDIADLARASVDPVFSRQLTESQFRDKEYERQRSVQLEDAKRIREQELADQDRQNTFDIQKTILMNAHDMAVNDPTGDIVSPGWMSFMKIGASGKLDPKIQEAWSIMAEGVGGRSLDANKEMFQQVIDLDEAMRKKTEHEYSSGKRAENELIDKKWKKDYETGQQLLNGPNFNRQGIINHLNNTHSIFTRDERNDIISRVTEAESDQEAKKIYNRALNEGNAKYQTRREMTAFPERFGSRETWYSETGEALGWKQLSPEGKWVYQDDPSKRGPLVSMGEQGHVKYAFERMSEADKEAAYSQKLLNSSEFIAQLIGDVETGAFTSAKILLGRVFASLNVPMPDNVDALIASQTATGDIGMQLLENFPGQISNEERKFVISIAPGLSQTKEGRRIVAEFWKRKAQKSLARQQIMGEYMGSSPTLWPEGKQSFNVRWQEYLDTHPAYEDLAVPPGREKAMGYQYRVIADPKTRRPFYLSFDGQYRDADGIILVSK